MRMLQSVHIKTPGEMITWSFQTASPV
uniref:Uncharacterized protein n=1 Tax=Anguilla anguilla TaxID=7936 RepID=A0A0E9SRB5_ANGAN